MNDYNNGLSSRKDNQSIRPLPPLPVSRRISRPLPGIPQALACKNCQACITSHIVLLPLTATYSSRVFRGYLGKASLFTQTYNVKLSDVRMQLMTSGAHAMQQITCSTCESYLGWKIIRTDDESEKWKEGSYLLELENLFNRNSFTSHKRLPSSSSSSSSSGSESDSSNYDWIIRSVSARCDMIWW